MFQRSFLHTLFNVSGLDDAPDTCLPQPLTVQAPGKAEKLHILAQILSQRLKGLQTNLSDKGGTMQWSWALSLN